MSVSNQMTSNDSHDQLLSNIQQIVAANLSVVPERRRAFFEGLHHLQAGEVPQAAAKFRKAARSCETPYDALAQWALGECERLKGREGASLRTWRKLAEDLQAPQAVRRMAWMSIAALEEAREDLPALARARKAIAALGEPALQ